MFMPVIILLFLVSLGAFPAQAGRFRADFATVPERKAVIARVMTVDVTPVRARISGNLTELSVDEGDMAVAGTRIAVVRDPTLPRQIAAVAAKVSSLMAERDRAALTLKRARELFAKGAVSQARLDDATTALEIASRQIEAARADQAALEARAGEGMVISPVSGRVLEVPVTKGAYVRNGDVIASIACDCYVLRLELPERHARFIHQGDKVEVGPRGLADPAAHDQKWRVGIIRQVYPELQSGRVIADVETTGLGDYFVGERAMVTVSTGSHRVILIPEAAVHRRFGVAFVTLADGGGDVVVQTGAHHEGMVEILSGLRPGDEVVTP